MKIGEIFMIRGVTQKGKNRVREHGNEWKIHTISNNDVLLESTSTGYLKWFGPDFEVVE